MRRSGRLMTCCDPRPPRGTAATLPRRAHRETTEVAILGRHEGRPPPPIRLMTAMPTALRSSAATRDGRHAAGLGDAACRCCCDPRPPRGTAATGTRPVRHAAHAVAILGRHEGRPPQDEAPQPEPVPEPVAILGRHEGRPPPRRKASRRPPKLLRSSAATRDGRHLGVVSKKASAIPQLRSSAATRDGRHSPPIRAAGLWSCGCDPRPPRGTAATVPEQAFPLRLPLPVCVMGDVWDSMRRFWLRTVQVSLSA